MISFEHDYLLWGLSLIPLLWWLQSKGGKPPALLFSSTNLAKEIAKKPKQGAGALKLALRSVALACLILGLARPQRGEGPQEEDVSATDILLMIDISGSMLALDFTHSNTLVTRLDAVKAVVREFIANRPNDRLGLIAFAGLPYMASPLTFNHSWLQKNLERLQIGLIEDGTAIGTALAMGVNHVKDLPSESRILILLTDGASNQGELSPLAAAEAAATFGVKIYTIAIGKGGIVPTFALNDHGKIATDRRGKPLVIESDFPVDYATLQKIAGITQGQAFRAENPQALAEVYKTIDSLEKRPIHLSRYSHYAELFWIPATLALLLLITELLLFKIRYRSFP